MLIDPVILLHIAFGGAAAGILVTGICLVHREWSWLLVSIPGLLLGLSLGLLLAVPMIETGRSLHSLTAMVIAGIIWVPPTYAIYRRLRLGPSLTSD